MVIFSEGKGNLPIINVINEMVNFRISSHVKVSINILATGSEMNVAKCGIYLR